MPRLSCRAEPRILTDAKRVTTVRIPIRVIRVQQVYVTKNRAMVAIPVGPRDARVCVTLNIRATVIRMATTVFASPVHRLAEVGRERVRPSVRALPLCP